MVDIFLGFCLIFFALCTLILGAAIGRLSQVLKEPEVEVSHAPKTTWPKEGLH